MGVANPTKLVEAFAINAGPAYITDPFPVASQIATNPGRASLNDGFTPLNMTPLANSGIPMSGPDLNGALKLISGISAAVSAGQTFYPFDDVYAAEIGGYALGAFVRDATESYKFWISALVNNATDPAVHPENWISSVPLLSTSAPTAGTHTDNVLPGPSDYFIDVDTTAGVVTLNGFVAQRDGQRITISDTGANNLNIGVNVGTAANRVRANAGPLTVVTNDSLTIQYVLSLLRWVVV
jgi:hypothetical protein